MITLWFQYPPFPSENRQILKCVWRLMVNGLIKPRVCAKMLLQVEVGTVGLFPPDTHIQHSRFEMERFEVRRWWSLG